MRNKRVHTFPKGIIPKVNIIEWLEFKLTYFKAAVKGILVITPSTSSHPGIWNLVANFIFYYDSNYAKLVSLSLMQWATLIHYKVMISTCLYCCLNKSLPVINTFCLTVFHETQVCESAPPSILTRSSFMQLFLVL